ncbi:MAG: Histidine--tRNA ligase [Dehalococcoides mccartyi]|uniref:hypothetical protein n=1 Tax=Dehalococcoides mccartyi TaxID=61435 RepID=UPI00242C79A0|nr:hypothetical protein [Dehalococcoides mccartyi]MCF7634873.1 Histidine--tRNA ligase [Dehalococcoides mccartyi]
MYEPTLELTGQIIEELQRSRGIYAECGEVIPGDTSFKDVMNFVRLPTINKALELYDNRPQWQDKPDKEGWWWYKRNDNGKLAVHLLKETASGELKTERIPLASDLRINTYPGKWLYIPEPEPYKGEE